MVASNNENGLNGIERAFAKSGKIHSNTEAAQIFPFSREKKQQKYENERYNVGWVFGKWQRKELQYRHSRISNTIYNQCDLHLVFIYHLNPYFRLPFEKITEWRQTKSRDANTETTASTMLTSTHRSNGILVIWYSYAASAHTYEICLHLF